MNSTGLKRCCCGILLFVLIGSSWLVAIADEVVISDDGRQIQLNADGTWVQLSKDRYATAADGERIRLKPDGLWSIVKSDRGLRTAEGTSNGASSKTIPPAIVTESTLFLAKVEILKRKIKRAKSSHAQTSTIYHVRLVNDSTDIIEIDDKLAASLTARSSAGAEYVIAAVSYDQATVRPGQRSNIRVVTEGSPQWFGVKFLSLEIAANALGNERKRILSKNMDEVVKRSVDTL